MGVVGLAQNKANSASIELELELGLSLAKKDIGLKHWILPDDQFENTV